MSVGEVRNRLNNLPQSHWLFRPAGARGEPTTRTTVLADPPLPPGHPAGPDPLPEATQAAFESALTDRQTATKHTHGVPVAPFGTTEPSNTPSAPTHSDSLVDQMCTPGQTTTLPLLGELPGKAMYEPVAGALICEQCGANRQPTFEGFLDTLQCHGSVTELDRSVIPPVALGLTLTPPEIEAAPVSPGLVCGLQILYNMAQDRYIAVEFDPVHDSPHEVLDLFGIGANDIQALKQEGLITIDKLQGYSYYTVTSEGRDLLRKPHRKSVEWGHGSGDNTETLLHIVMVTALRRYVEQTYVTNPESPITQVTSYYELTASENDYGLDAGTRFDLVGLDASGSIRLIGEAERVNNDRKTAAINDYDKIAAVNPDEALWVVPTSSKGHKAVLEPLSSLDSGQGDPRIDGYSESTRISTITGVSEPGMTGIHTLHELRKQLDEPSLLSSNS